MSKELIRKMFTIIPQPYRVGTEEALKGTKFEGLQFEDWDREWTTEMTKKATIIALEHTIEALDDLLGDEVNEIVDYQDVEVILLAKVHYQKELEKLSNV